MSLKTMIGSAAALLMIAGSAQAAELWGWNTFDDGLYTIDTTGPSSAFVGTGPSSIIAEIEYGDGVIYGSDTSDNTLLHHLDPATGAAIGLTVMSFPPEGDVITSMEFVGGTLYGGLTTEGGGPTFLSIIDIGTGTVSVVGPTGFGSPFGGLAYDGSTMYGVSAGGSSGELFTLDLGTGAATSVGLVGFGTTALEFGTDGILYGAPSVGAGPAGHLLMIDPATGVGTDLGFTGVDGLVALTSIPAPSTIALLGFAGLLRRRR